MLVESSAKEGFRPAVVVRPRSQQTVAEVGSDIGLLAGVAET